MIQTRVNECIVSSVYEYHGPYCVNPYASHTYEHLYAIYTGIYPRMSQALWTQ